MREEQPLGEGEIPAELLPANRVESRQTESGEHPGCVSEHVNEPWSNGHLNLKQCRDHYSGNDVTSSAEHPQLVITVGAVPPPDHDPCAEASQQSDGDPTHKQPTEY